MPELQTACVFCRRKAAFLLKLEVLEALAKHGVCMWGRSCLGHPEEGMESHQTWVVASCMCAAAVLAYRWAACAEPGVGWRQLLGLSSLVNAGGVPCCCWAGGNYFQLWRGGLLEWETLAREEDCWLLRRCGSAEQAPPGDRAEGEQVSPVLALAAAVVAP